MFSFDIASGPLCYCSALHAAAHTAALLHSCVYLEAISALWLPAIVTPRLLGL